MDICIVTGASSVIGSEYVDTVERVCDGIDELWVISGQRGHLTELTKRYERIRVVPVPLELNEEMSYSFIGEMLKTNEPNVKMLINCCGASEYGAFTETDEKRIFSLIDLNIRAVLAFEKMCLPYMNTGSYIINCGSVSSFAPLPMQAVYSPCKTFLRCHSKALRGELLPQGINVMTVIGESLENEYDPSIAEENAYLTAHGTDLRALTERSLKAAAKGKAAYIHRGLCRFLMAAGKILPESLAVKLVSGGKK
ncbi:MAG: SDR family NAD(P)-dependent oxidoreductase [Ruminiclostridium sp.]|nr:SDR family NAD(P)-dependent oxidoreductase [Ruminiclostridium sp.]